MFGRMLLGSSGSVVSLGRPCVAEEGSPEGREVDLVVWKRLGEAVARRQDGGPEIPAFEQRRVERLREERRGLIADEEVVTQVCLDATGEERRREAVRLAPGGHN